MLASVTIFADFYAARFIFLNIVIGIISCNHFAGPIADLVIARFPIHIGCMPPPEALACIEGFQAADSIFRLTNRDERCRLIDAL